MYAYVKGTVEDTGLDHVVIDVGGVGYLIYAPTRVISSLQKGSTAKIYTYLYVREDAFTLYGFTSNEEKSMFLRLLSVGGIGPKLAMAVLSHLSVADVAIALVSGDISTLVRVPGLGKKTAQRLILELKEKVDNSELAAGMTVLKTEDFSDGSAVSEAVSALVALGIPSYDAQRAIRSFDTTGLAVGDIITKVLQSMDKGR